MQALKFHRRNRKNSQLPRRKPPKQSSHQVKLQKEEPEEKQSNATGACPENAVKNTKTKRTAAAGGAAKDERV